MYSFPYFFIFSREFIDFKIPDDEFLIEIGRTLQI
jgi:hypothetical protein